MDKKICVVDDDKMLVTLIKKYLKDNGFEKVYDLNPKQLIDMPVIDFDLIILDIMMPNIDGFEVCKAIRKKTKAFIIFLSAKTEVFDKILGLELGADDYMTKPFEPRELLARINALFRRHTMEEDEKDKVFRGKLEFEELTFDLDKQIIIKNGKEHSLTTYEYMLLEYFCDNLNLVISREMITTHLESKGYFTFDRSIDNGISRLRKKLEDEESSTKYLKTIWGRGYQLVLTKK